MYHSPARVRPRQRSWSDVGCVPTAAPKGRRAGLARAGCAELPQRGRAGGPKGRTPAAIVQPHLRVIQLQVRRQASGEGRMQRSHSASQTRQRFHQHSGRRWREGQGKSAQLMSAAKGVSLRGAVCSHFGYSGASRIAGNKYYITSRFWKSNIKLSNQWKCIEEIFYFWIIKIIFAKNECSFLFLHLVI